jgi:uncharacterized membrane protein
MNKEDTQFIIMGLGLFLNVIGGIILVTAAGWSLYLSWNKQFILNDVYLGILVGGILFVVGMIMWRVESTLITRDMIKTGKIS